MTLANRLGMDTCSVFICSLGTEGDDDEEEPDGTAASVKPPEQNENPRSCKVKTRLTVIGGETLIEVDRIVEDRLSTRRGLIEKGENLPETPFDIFRSTT